MNFMYYKGFSEDKGTTAHTGYKKKKDPRKKNNAFQHGPEGHVLGCECEVCSTEFPLRTHLLIDMSYSRLSGGQDQTQTPKTSTASRFSFFSRKKYSAPSAAAQTSAALAFLQEQRRFGAAREQKRIEEEAVEMASSSQDPVTLGTLKQDSLMIPMGRMSHFFPAGHPVRPTPCTLSPHILGIPTGSNQQGRMKVLEAPEQSLHVVFHMLGPATPVTPALCSPLTHLYSVQRDCLVKAFKSAVAGAGVGGSIGGPGGGSVLQGMVLLNLERGGELGEVEFPFMVVWVVDGRQCEARHVIQRLRQHSLEAFDPIKTGFTCTHYFDTFEEVAILARPPLERMSRKATTSSTGYIITVFKVFEGDDSVKFERNWLGWTGARTLYKSLTTDVGLRRLTLHKSRPQNGSLHYVLLCDCSQFLTSINHAVKAIPSLRMRLCGDMGLYRPITTY